MELLIVLSVAAVLASVLYLYAREEDQLDNELERTVKLYISLMTMHWMTDQEAQDFIDEHGFDPTPEGFGWKFSQIIGVPLP